MISSSAKFFDSYLETLSTFSTHEQKKNFKWPAYTICQHSVEQKF